MTYHLIDTENGRVVATAPTAAEALSRTTCSICGRLLCLVCEGLGFCCWCPPLLPEEG